MSHKRWLSQRWALVFILSDLLETAINAQYCVAKAGADPTALANGLSWVCGPGGANCSPIQPGQVCYVANNLTAIASYAYNDYYQRTRATGGTCNFNNTATTTFSNPSFGSCTFSISTGTGTPTSLSPTSAPTVFGSPTTNGYVPTFDDATSISSDRSVVYLLPLMCYFLYHVL